MLPFIASSRPVPPWPVSMLGSTVLTGGGGGSPVPWTPSQLGSTKLKAWHKSETFTSALWPDNSGNSRDFIQATGANQPDVSPNGGARFQDAARKMSSSLSAVDDTEKSFAVITLPAPGGVRTIIGSTTTGGRQIRLQSTAKTTALRQQAGNLSVGDQAIVLAQKTIVMFRAAGASSSFQLDGSEIVESSSAGAFSGGGTTQLGVGGVTTEPFYNATGGYGDIHEVIATIGTITTAEENRIVGYLAWKHGTVALLPADHPYKNEAPLVGVGPLYAGQVATRCGQANVLFSGNLQAMSRRMHFARDAIVNPTAIFGNFYVPNGTNVETDGGAGTIKASIEYPAGVFTLANENIANAGAPIVFPNGLTILSFNVNIPNGAQFWTRVFMTNVNGCPYMADETYDPSEGFAGGATTTDRTMGGTVPFAGAGSHPVLTPLVIFAQTRTPGVAIHGDSRAAGSEEQTTDALADGGDIARSIGPAYGYSKFTTNGTRLNQYLVNRTYRDQVQKYFSHIVDAYGRNDLVGGDSAATLAANRTIFAGLFPRAIVVGTTPYNTTTSTDGWTTLANQTITQDHAAFRALAVAGIAGEAFCCDVKAGLDPGATGKFPVAPAPTTADGIHVINAGALAIKNSGVVNPAQFTRA